MATTKVATIYYEERYLSRPLFCGNFHAPAVPKGDKPFILEVRDHIQPERMPHIVGGRRIPVTIHGEEIARDIIQHWTTGVLGMTGDVHPGIWVVRETITLRDDSGTPVKDVYGAVQSRPATDEEKTAMWAEDLSENKAAQTRWAEFNIQQGDVLASDSNTKMRLMIGPTMKLSVKYQGRERDWCEEMKDDDVKACKFCFKSIDSRVVVCPECKNVVDPQRYAELNRADAAIVAKTKSAA